MSRTDGASLSHFLRASLTDTIKAIWILDFGQTRTSIPLIALGSTTHYKKTTWVSTTLVSCCVECELVHFLTAGFWALKSGQMLMSEHEKSLWCCLEPSSQIFFFVCKPPCTIQDLFGFKSDFKVWLLCLFVFVDAHRKRYEYPYFGFNFSQRDLRIKIGPDVDEWTQKITLMLPRAW